MKRFAFAVAALATLVSGDAFAQVAGCSTSGLGTPYQRVVAGKAVFLVAYTNLPRRMDAYCAVAARTGAHLILKTQSLNGKLHRRCG